jgi:hypothetical protein
LQPVMVMICALPPLLLSYVTSIGWVIEAGGFAAYVALKLEQDPESQETPLLVPFH